MKILVFSIALIVSTSAFGQKNLIFTELGGNGGLTSLNYERQLTKELGLSLRVGLGVTVFEFEEEEPPVTVNGCVVCGLDVFPGPQFSLTVPISVQYLFDLNNNNYFETGLGNTQHIPASDNDKNIGVVHGSIGFRRYFGSEKWMWKVVATPIIGAWGDNIDSGSEPTIWAGFAIGRRF